MSSVFKYRLQPLLDQKVDLKDKAARLLAQRQEEVQRRKTRLGELEAEQKAIVQRRQDQRMRMVPQGGTKGFELHQRADYLQALEADLEQAKQAVFSQRIAVEDAEDEVTRARAHLADCSREVETLTKHKEKAEQQFRQERDRKEALEQEEIGALLYETRRRKE